MLRSSFQGISKWIYGSGTSSVILRTRRLLSESEYHKAADESLETLLIDLEQYFDELQTPEVDISYSQGVLTLSLGSRGTYVINKQAPNKQIWLSSPISGPFRYDYEKGEWIYHRDLHNMKSKISDELISMYKKEPKLH